MKSQYNALHRVTLFSFLFVFAISESRAFADNSCFFEVSAPQSFSYKMTIEDGAKTPIQLDLISPKLEYPEQRFPSVVLIHGGAWRYGDRRQFQALGNRLAEKGIVAILVDYRKAPSNVWPAQKEDLQDVLTWIHANQERFQLAPNRLGFFGYSAGAQLAFLMGAQNSEKVNAVFMASLPSGFSNPPQEADPQLLSYWLGGSRSDVPRKYISAAPEQNLGPSLPALYFLHGELEQDYPIALNDVRLLHEAALELGADSQLEVISGGTHRSTLADADFTKRVIDFFELKLNPPMGNRDESHLPVSEESSYPFNEQEFYSNLTEKWLSLDVSEMTHIDFGFLGPSETEYSNPQEGLLQMNVNESASFLVQIFREPVAARKVSFEWRRLQGDKEVSTSQEEQSASGDDFYLRVGLVLKGPEPEVMGSYFLPSWLKTFRNLLRQADQSTSRMLMLVAGTRCENGTDWVSPSRKEEGDIRMVAVGGAEPEQDQWRCEEIDLSTSDDLWDFVCDRNFGSKDGARSQFGEVVGIWIMSDGDQTESSFVVQLKNLCISR